MNLTRLDDKQLYEMERLANDLAVLLKRMKSTDTPLYLTLRDLSKEAGSLRRERFDEHDSRYRGY